MAPENLKKIFDCQSIKIKQLLSKPELIEYLFEKFNKPLKSNNRQFKKVCKIVDFIGWRVQSVEVQTLDDGNYYARILIKTI